MSSPRIKVYIFIASVTKMNYWTVYYICVHLLKLHMLWYLQL